jgi:3D-(3,5/4)-trihydroxycyclohexane-1,2-dione acylhydrolase (decyclizing)
MMAQEIHTAVQEGYKLNIVLLDTHGFKSIGSLSRACGCEGFGTRYRLRRDGKLQGEINPVDFVANAASLGAEAVRASTRDELTAALEKSRANSRTTVVVIEVDNEVGVPSYESWWDVPVAETAQLESVGAARRTYDTAKLKERYYLSR